METRLDEIMWQVWCCHIISNLLHTKFCSNQMSCIWTYGFQLWMRKCCSDEGLRVRLTWLFIFGSFSFLALRESVVPFLNVILFWLGSIWWKNTVAVSWSTKQLQDLSVNDIITRVCLCAARLQKKLVRIYEFTNYHHDICSKLDKMI